MSYRIKSVASLTGISPTTLRAWERRYDLVTPRRTHSGYRVYSEHDVAMLAQIKSLVDKGFKVGEAISLVRNGTEEPPAALTDPREVQHVREQVLEALLDLDRTRAVTQYRRLASLPFDRQVDEIILPLMRRVGDLWERGETSVAQEHFSSAFVRERLVGMLHALDCGPDDGHEVVFAGAPGELHEFGLMAAAVHLAMRGWKITYLGADVPVEELRSILCSRKPALICTSLIRPRPCADCYSLAASLRAVSPPETCVVIGGAGVAEEADSCRGTGLYLLRRLEELFRIPELNQD